jgi:hypothetical protein
MGRWYLPMNDRKKCPPEHAGREPHTIEADQTSGLTATLIATTTSGCSATLTS